MNITKYQLIHKGVKTKRYILYLFSFLRYWVYSGRILRLCVCVFICVDVCVREHVRICVYVYVCESFAIREPQFTGDLPWSKECYLLTNIAIQNDVYRETKSQQIIYSPSPDRQTDRHWTSTHPYLVILNPCALQSFW